MFGHIFDAVGDMPDITCLFPGTLSLAFAVTHTVLFPCARIYVPVRVPLSSDFLVLSFFMIAALNATRAWLFIPLAASVPAAPFSRVSLFTICVSSCFHDDLIAVRTLHLLLMLYDLMDENYGSAFTYACLCFHPPHIPDRCIVSNIHVFRLLHAYFNDSKLLYEQVECVRG